MERIPSDFFPTYDATSIADMMGNEEILHADHHKWLTSRSPLFRAAVWAAYTPEKLGTFLAGEKWQEPFVVHVNLFSVRHWPAKDRVKNGSILTLYDQTGECEVVMMNSVLKGRDINPDLLKNQSWYANVVLRLSFETSQKLNMQWLVDIDNIPAPVTENAMVEPVTTELFVPQFS